MNKEIADKWTNALRSGKYEQGRQRLRSIDNKFCCLGVLCDLLNPSEWRQHDRETGYIYGPELAASFLPTSVIKMTEMNSWDGGIPETVIENEPFKSLDVLNDAGISSEQIADIIERHREQL